MTPLEPAAQPDLFSADAAPSAPEPDLQLAPGAWLLRGHARDEAAALLDAIERIARAAPFRHMATPRGSMSVAMTNSGSLGWLSDRGGYRYAAVDPETDRPWPPLPELFIDLAARAALAAGFAHFAPNACLVNRYEPGARLSLHQDRDEGRLDAPVVSVSLGVPATFLWGGATRAEKPQRVRLEHGDVVVWGGPSRLAFHGVDTLREGHHPRTGTTRFNLTFRRALAPR